jgi:hypothetical protein
VLARLVARDWDDNVASHGQVVKIPFTGSLSVNDKAADTVITLARADRHHPSRVTLNKHKEVSASSSRISRASWPGRTIQAQYIADGMAKVARSRSTATSPRCTPACPRRSTRPLAWPRVTSARRASSSTPRRRRSRNRYAVLHEDAEYEFLGIEKAVNRDYAAEPGRGRRGRDRHSVPLHGL